MSDSVHANHSTTQRATNDAASEESVWGFLSSPTFLWSFCALGIALVLGDLVTTVYGLEMGLREQNPFVLAVMGKFGVAGLVGLKILAVSWVAVIWRVLGRRYGVAAMAGLMLPQGIAVGLNVLTIVNAA